MGLGATLPNHLPACRSEFFLGAPYVLDFIYDVFVVIHVFFDFMLEVISDVVFVVIFYFVFDVILKVVLDALGCSKYKKI